jgi:hypothetical protein
MPMVPFAAFVVVQYGAFTGHHIRESVLESVPGRRYRLANAPNYHFNERILSNDDATPNQRNGLHVGENNNTGACCQLLQHSGKIRGLDESGVGVKFFHNESGLESRAWLQPYPEYLHPGVSRNGHAAYRELFKASVSADDIEMAP